MSRPISGLKLRQVADLTFQMVTNAKITQAPVDVDVIAKYCGVSVEKTDLGQDVTGLLIAQGDDAVIAYSANQGEQRRRFTIAHELGHFVLHRDEGTDTVFVDKDFIVKYRSNKLYSDLELRQEQEANAFAASLLMPREFIFEEISKDRVRNLPEAELISELAKTFNVSVPAMTFRLSNLNILY
ncbi:ImmA/IrrE family metallo-endopeptidase [Pedobacter boryungensis]|uniref:ImmA/IrrE family metallo-endopeptidase n=1 Tax=Pedobacter boryungensis TaxID=869962 RepID=A0ABX2DFA0_9SPHI|nr:ImmA/IrrE family metallo-endopeptidase [Pedobacter boryungensis]NQX31646.1 ImmA/IrrE family metallo-endopeptidase [Pedobacter boryungensis]